MKSRIIAIALAAFLFAGTASAQVINGSLVGGGSASNPLRYTPSLWLDSSQQYCYTDAACQFTAADKSWLQITDAAQTGLDLGTDDGLICGWVWCDSASNTNRICNKGASANNDGGFNITVNAAGSVEVVFGDGSGATRITTTTDAGLIGTCEWKFVAVYFDRTGDVTIYVNDQVVKTGAILTQQAAINSAGAFQVGYYSAGYFNGRLDSLMFFKAADLSAVASDIIAWAYNSGAGRLCSEITTAQKTAWGAISGWELGENSGRRYDSWGPNHLDQAFAELVTNGTFTGNSTGWTEGAGWAYGTNNEAATAAEADLAQATVVPTVGKLYSTSFVAAVTSGTLRLNLGGVTGTTRSTSATHTETVRATSTASLVIDPVAAYTGTVDTVSVMAAEILPAPGIVRGLSQDSNFAVQLNGTTQYLSRADTGASDDFRAGDFDFEVGMWFYRDNSQTTSILFSKDGTGKREWSLFIFSGALYFTVYDGTTGTVGTAVTGVSAILPGNWYFARGWHDATADKVYLKVNESTLFTAPTYTGVPAGNTEPIRIGLDAIGAVPAPLRMLAGRVDQTYFKKGISTDAEALALYNNGEGVQWADIGIAGTALETWDDDVKGFWEFDDKTALGTDSTTNANTLTNTGTATQGQGVNYLEGVISYWDDRGSAGNNALMETLAKRPSYSTVGGPNNRPEIVFDGVDDYLRSTFTLNQPCTVFIVGRFSANSDVMLDGVTGDMIFWRDATSKVEIDAGTALEGQASDANDHVFSAIFNGNSSSITVDGGTATSGAAGAGNPGGITLGVDRDASSNPLDGAITAVVVYPQALTAGQRSAVTARLKSIYAISP